MRKYLSAFSTALLLVAALVTGVSAYAQEPGRGRGPDPNAEPPGESAGGNWMVFQSEDAMTAAKLVMFQLESNNTMPDSDRRSKIILYCKNGKLEHTEFEPSIRMSGPNRPGFWGQPQMEVTVRVDNAHSYHGWNWGGRSLSMDKGTVRELIGANLFRVEFLGQRRQSGPAAHIAEFSSAGLDLAKVRHACDITPKKP
jgi:hypothetical protein